MKNLCINNFSKSNRQSTKTWRPAYRGLKCFKNYNYFKNMMLLIILRHYFVKYFWWNSWITYILLIFWRNKIYWRTLLGYWGKKNFLYRDSNLHNLPNDQNFESKRFKSPGLMHQFLWSEEVILVQGPLKQNNTHSIWFKNFCITFLPCSLSLVPSSSHRVASFDDPRRDISKTISLAVIFVTLSIHWIAFG